MTAVRQFYETVSLRQQLFARLLATENLTVTYARVPTAAFNVDTRTLILPLYQLSDDETSMLVAHEVGHALFTPNSLGMRERIEDIAPLLANVDLFGLYINIVEDARIERLMKRRYPGLTKVFAQGYRQIFTDRSDIFGFGGMTSAEIAKKVAEMPPADRVNLAAKIGALIPMKLTPEETAIYEQMMAAESFEDVVKIAADLWELGKAHQEQAPQTADDEKKHTEPVPPSAPDDGYDDQNEGGTMGSSSAPAPVPDKNGTEQTPTKSTQNGDTEGTAPDVQTQRQLDSYLDRAAKSIQSRRSFYPKSTVQTALLNTACIERAHAIVPFQQVWDLLISQNDNGMHQAWRAQEVSKYKHSQGPLVAYMASEFMRRQSAKEYRKVAYAKTGSINPAKLARYMVTEDIFLQQMVRPDGKRHGVVLMIDGSSSMSSHMTGVIDQTMNMLLFGRHVNIPVHVYMFSNSWARQFSAKQLEIVRTPSQRHTRVADHIRLVQLADSTFTGSKWTRCLELLVSIRTIFNDDYTSMYARRALPPKIHMPQMVSPVKKSGFTLGGTPLYQGMVLMGSVLQQFRAQTRVEKLSGIVLTDGEDTDHLSTGTSVIDGEDTLMDEPTRLVFQPSEQPLTDRLAQWIACVAGATMVGVRLVGSVNEIESAVDAWVQEKHQQRATRDIQRTIREKGWGPIPHLQGFKAAYMVEAANKLKTTATLDVDQTMTSDQIMEATRTYNNQRQNAKAFISHFIEQWA